MRTQHKLGLVLGLCTMLGCVIGPQNDADIGSATGNISISGYASTPEATVCVYARKPGASTWSKRVTLTASDTKSGLYGNVVDLYAYSGSFTIPFSRWECDLPLDDNAKSEIKVQERASGSCASSPSTSQDDLDYTYDDGTNLSACYTGNSSWSDFLDDCPISDDAPITTLLGENGAIWPNGCGPECTLDSQCAFYGGNDPCKEYTCTNNICDDPVDRPEGYLCGAGPKVCETAGGDCIPKKTDASCQAAADPCYTSVANALGTACIDTVVTDGTGCSLDGSNTTDGVCESGTCYCKLPFTDSDCATTQTGLIDSGEAGKDYVCQLGPGTYACISSPDCMEHVNGHPGACWGGNVAYGNQIGPPQVGHIGCGSMFSDSKVQDPNVSSTCPDAYYFFSTEPFLGTICEGVGTSAEYLSCTWRVQNSNGGATPTIPHGQ